MYQIFWIVWTSDLFFDWFLGKSRFVLFPENQILSFDLLNDGSVLLLMINERHLTIYLLTSKCVSISLVVHTSILNCWVIEKYVFCSRIRRNAGSSLLFLFRYVCFAIFPCSRFSNDDLFVRFCFRCSVIDIYPNTGSQFLPNWKSIFFVILIPFFCFILVFADRGAPGALQTILRVIFFAVKFFWGRKDKFFAFQCS